MITYERKQGEKTKKLYRDGVQVNKKSISKEEPITVIERIGNKKWQTGIIFVRHLQKNQP